MDPLQNYYHHIQQEEKEALHVRVEKAYRLSSVLASLDSERSRLIRDAAFKKISPSECTAAIRKLSEKERNELNRLGLPEDYLQLHYRCSQCQDTGYIDRDHSHPCSCRLLLKERILGETGINSRETFSSFSESIYPEEIQKKRATKAMRICKEYAESLPSPRLPNLLLLGMPGLGKTFLGNAIAFSALEHGIECKKVTAYRFIQDILSDIREHTSSIEYYQSVPLLVLDDLGSEPIIPNVSSEWLFAVLNERTASNSATVFISNLSLAGLQERYGERISSRLYDQNTTVCLQLTGKNLRTI
jgi:DNA replication protein DnaC